MITGFNHVGISVRDLDRSIAFYTELFGMELMSEPFPFGGAKFEQVMALPGAKGRMAFVAKGGLALELFEFASPTPAPKDPGYPVSTHGISHFGFNVADIAAEYDRLAAAGVTFHCPVLQFEGAGVKATYGRDPDGNVFELLQMPVKA